MLVDVCTCLLANEYYEIYSFEEGGMSQKYFNSMSFVVAISDILKDNETASDFYHRKDTKKFEGYEVDYEELACEMLSSKGICYYQFNDDNRSFRYQAIMCIAAFENSIEYCMVYYNLSLSNDYYFSERVVIPKNKEFTLTYELLETFAKKVFDRFGH